MIAIDTNILVYAHREDSSWEFPGIHATSDEDGAFSQQPAFQPNSSPTS